MFRLALLFIVVLAGCPDDVVVAPGCPAGQSLCGSACADRQTDPKHCGSCDVACAAGEVCANATCVPTSCADTPCEAGLVCVGTRCVDRACVGVTCGAGEACAQGECGCAEGFLSCGGSCVNPKTSTAHCGGCDRPCEGVCVDGTCAPVACGTEPCAAGLVCVGDACVERSCVGVACGPGERCLGGTCTCDASHRSCGGACVDTRSDNAHCGGCDRKCDATEACVGGRCYPVACNDACAPGSVCFSGDCVQEACLGVTCEASEECRDGACVSCGPLDTDAHCGACDRACAADARCVKGECAPRHCDDLTCGAGEVCSGGACVEVACVGVTCDAGEECRAGTCVSCGPLDTDAHCGACDRACTSATRCVKGACAPRSCADRTCGLEQVCSAGSCVDVACVGVTCGAHEACSGGRCGCAAGFDRCDGEATCRPLGDDPLHCGRCDNACTDGARCVGGDCGCAEGLSQCGLACVDKQVSPTNCGDCGRTCGATQVCNGGRCTCAEGFTVCGTSCFDTRSDNLHCGTCTKVCATNETCSGGTCVKPITCARTFNADAATGCPYFPTTAAGCGEESLARSITVSSVAASGDANRVTTPILVGPADVVRVFGTAVGPTGSTAFGDELLTEAGVRRAYESANTGTSPVVVKFAANGSPLACNQITAYRASSLVGTSRHDLTLDVYTRARANSGGPSLALATPLRTLDGSTRICDQVCGQILSAPCWEKQYWKFTIPAGKAVDVSWIARAYERGGAALKLDLFDRDEVSICSLESVAVGDTADRGNDRIVNNSAEDRLVWLRLTTATGTLDEFDVAVTTER